MGPFLAKTDPVFEIRLKSASSSAYGHISILAKVRQFYLSGPSKRVIFGPKAVILVIPGFKKVRLLLKLANLLANFRYHFLRPFFWLSHFGPFWDQK
jgi:hypothetical protein